MAVHVIKRGLDLPITGEPEQRIDDAPEVGRVALLAYDYPFMRPRMHASLGDLVKRGELLFEDRKTEGVRFTSPGAGKLVAVNRGDKRALQSVVIELIDDGPDNRVSFDSYTGAPVESLEAPQVRALLAESGQWTALRARPYGKVPSPSEECAAIFVTAMDTSPGSMDVDVAYAGHEEDLRVGLVALAKLSKVYLCVHEGSKVSAQGVEGVSLESFTGPHPAGLAGTHIHLLLGVSRTRGAWHLGLQDAIAVGHLFRTGRLGLERVVAFSGPAVLKPRLLRTRLGASVDALVAGGLKPGENRVVSGSALFGHAAAGEVHGYLGRYAQQISALAEGRDRELLGWMMPGIDKFSVIPAFVSALMGGRRFAFTTNTEGSHRAMVPIGSFEKVMPLDILPTFLLRALAAGDLERAEQLGCMELIEEDLALCSFVAPGKEDWGVALRALLTTIWKEG